MEDYYKVDRLSFSKLFLLKDTAKHYTWLKDNKENTKAMIFGNVVHTMVLEPEEFENRYILQSDILVPTLVKKKKPTKKELKDNPGLQDWYELEEFEDIPLNNKLKAHKLWMEDYKGKIIISEKDLIQAKAMRLSIMENFESSILINNAETEKEYFYEFEGIPMKSKVDIVGENYLADLKTIQAGKLANPRQLYWHIVNMGYDIQAALYCYASGRTINEYHLLFVEKDAPYSTRIITLHKQDLDYGWNKFLRLIDKYRAYQDGSLDKNTDYRSLSFSDMIDYE